MKKLLALLSATFLLTACGGGPQTAQYGTATLTYDSGVWETFSNELATGLGVRGDASCWIDLNGDLTTPSEYEGLEQSSDGTLTLHTDPISGTAQYLSFPVGSETVYGRVSVESPDSCVGQMMLLMEMTLGE